MAVVSDRFTIDSTGYQAELLSAQDYYPFGLAMPGRSLANPDSYGGDYRYGFNGKERDPEGLGGGGSTYDYGFRIYNPGIGKFLSVDPLSKNYAHYSSYQFAGLNPVWAIDLDGLEELVKPFEREHYFPVFSSPDMITGVNNAGHNTMAFIANLGINTANIPANAINFIYYLFTTTDDLRGPALQLKAEQAIKEEVKRVAGQTFSENLREWGNVVVTLENWEAAPDLLIGTKIASLSKFQRLNVKPNITQTLPEGGAYGRIKNFYDDDGNLVSNRNHLPTRQSYKLAGFQVSDYIGSSNIMSISDHKLFISTGNDPLAKIFRQTEAQLLKEGRFLDAFDLNANAIREQFGSKYDVGLNQARQQYIDEVIPVLESQQ